MIKKKLSNLLKIFLIMISVLACSGIGISKFFLYKGTDFVKGNDFGYREGLRSSITNYVSRYGDIIIKNGELSIESGIYRRLDFYEDEKLIFIVDFENASDKELDAIFNKHYAKVDVYKEDHNKNSISFALFGKNKFISYIFDPSKDVRYTQYEQKMEGDFSTIDSFSFKNDLLDQDKFNYNLNVLLNSVGNSYKRKIIKENGIKISLFSVITYIFALSILLIFKRKIEFLDIIINAMSIIFVCALPYLVIGKSNFDILLLLALIIGTAVSLILSKREKNE